MCESNKIKEHLITPRDEGKPLYSGVVHLQGGSLSFMC